MDKMIFTAYKDGDFQEKAGFTYDAMLNPEKIDLDRTIKYVDKPKPGASKNSPEFSSAGGSQLSFELIVDCTGVVDSKKTDLPKNLAGFKKVVYDYNGTVHRPNFVRITWGEGLDFKGVLTSMKVIYTLFTPSGKPLRAKVSLSFSSYVSPKQAAKEEDKNSPDMTHIIPVVEGDTLANLSFGTYQTTEICIPLARFNDLNRFRNLQHGHDLIFPPLVAGAG